MTAICQKFNRQDSGVYCNFEEEVVLLKNSFHPLNSFIMRFSKTVFGTAALAAAISFSCKKDAHVLIPQDDLENSTNVSRNNNGRDLEAPNSTTS
jgi:hypothetical protein